MSETAEIAERDQASGQFLKGYKGGPGRKLGSRNKLGEAFIEDLRDCWEEYGAQALRRCAVEDPAAFCRIVAGLMPRDVNLNMSLNASEFADKWRQASEILGHDVTMPMSRRPLRVVSPTLPGSARGATKVIEP
jgi:hypothetical protein